MFIFLILALVQLSDGRPAATVVNELSLPVVADGSPTILVVDTTRVPQLLGDLSPIQLNHPSTFLPRADSLAENGTNFPQVLKMSDSDMKVAISTTLCLRFVADRKIDVFRFMKRNVRHPRPIAKPRPTARGYMPRTSLRSPSPVSGMSYASTMSTIPMKEISPPAPVLVKDRSPAQH
ncbi:hypothetical protein C0995_009925 [Termitomyces sp. Mi166|nr:hypothetical protein C0995_009925 [Termitomyces sp. Mi166\